MALIGIEYDPRPLRSYRPPPRSGDRRPRCAAYLTKLDSWRKSLSSRYASAPAPGTLIGVDERGATIGERSALWSEVRFFERTEFQNPPGWRCGRLVVLRVRLNGRLGDRLIDASLVDNGQAIVNAVFRRLAPEPPSGLQ